MNSILDRTAGRLDGLGIPWLVFGGAAIAFYGGARGINDVDVMAGGSLTDLERALPDFEVSEAAVQSGIVEVWPDPLVFDVPGGGHYVLPMDAEMLRKARMASAYTGNADIRCLSPEDLIVMKSIQQRGASVGKADGPDVQLLLRLFRNDLDLTYMRWRISQCGASERVDPFLTPLLR